MRGAARVPWRLVVALLAIAAVGVLGGSATWAAFDGATSSAANQVSAGTVEISDDDGGSAMLGFTAGMPGTTDTGCITVSYSGSLASTVRLYGATTGTGLDAHLSLEVTRGSFDGATPAFESCAGFSADPTDYVGSGPGVVYAGTLEGYPDSYAAGLVDPAPGAPEAWTAGEAHAYRFRVTLRNEAAARGRSATQSFTWEPRSR